MGRRIAIVWVASGLLWTGAVPALAQDDGDDGFEGIDQIVVTARKREEDLQEVPIAVSAFTGDALEDAGIIETIDLQHVTPNLYFFSGNSGASNALISMRGQSQADSLLTTDGSVGVYIDGVNMPRTLGLGANQFDLERVEVLKGPQGTLYGRNTTGGAINLISKKADHEAGLSGFLDVTVGNFSKLDYSAAINIPILPDQLTARLAFRRTEHNGYGKSLAGELADDDEWFFRGNVVWDPTEDIHVVLAGDYQKVDEEGSIVKLTALSTTTLTAAFEAGAELASFPAGVPALQQIIADGKSDFYRTASDLGRNVIGPDIGATDSDGRNEVETWGLSGTVTVSLPNDLLLTSITGYRRFTKTGFNDLDGTPFVILEPRLPAELWFFSQEFQLAGDLIDGMVDWQLGAYYSKEQGRDGSRTLAVAALNPANPSILDGAVENRSWAVFAQATWHITDDLNLTAGVRRTEDTKKLTSTNASGAPFMPGFVTCNTPIVPFGMPSVVAPVDQRASACAFRTTDDFTGYSWLASLDYAFTDDILGYVKAARGFRAGGQNLRGGSDPSSFASFAPEKARDVEVGLKTTLFDNRVRLNVAGFWTDYTDIQRSVIVPSTGGNIVTVLTNAAAATILGGEIELLVEPIEGLTVTGSVGLTDAEYDSFDDTDPLTLAPLDRSDEPFAMPKWQTYLSARYEREIGPGVAGFQVGWSWTDERDFRSTVTDPSFPKYATVHDAYSLVNARLDYDHHDWGVEIALWANNVFDEEYFVGNVNLTALGYWVSIAGNPRTYGFTVTKRFGGE